MSGISRGAETLGAWGGFVVIPTNYIMFDVVYRDLLHWNIFLGGGVLISKAEIELCFAYLDMLLPLHESRSS